MRLEQIMNGGVKREGEKENDKKGEDVFIVGIEFLIVVDASK